MLAYYLLGAVAAAFAILAGLGIIWRSVRRFIVRLNDFFEDWYGRQPRDGRPAEKGVMARLKDQDDVLAYLKAEVSYDHGQSLKDSVRNVHRDLTELKQHLQGEIEQ